MNEEEIKKYYTTTDKDGKPILSVFGFLYTFVMACACLSYIAKKSGGNEHVI